MDINGDLEWGYNVCLNATVTIPKWWVCGAGGPTLIWMNGLWSMMVMFFQIIPRKRMDSWQWPIVMEKRFPHIS